MKESRVEKDMHIIQLLHQRAQGYPIVVVADYLAFVYLLFILNFNFNHIKIQYFPIFLNFYPSPSPNFNFFKTIKNS